MPVSARPAGSISPGDLLWKHELRQQNATLLARMTALEARFKDQEMRVLKAEEAAAACTGVNEDFSIVKDGVDQLEKRQHDFMKAMHKRLVEMDKDMGEFRKTQERVNSLMTSYRELDDSVTNMTAFGSRIEEVEREIQGLKNTISRKHVHEMENLDSRMGELELELSREYAKIRAMQGSYTQKWTGELQALRTQVNRLEATDTGTRIQHPYMQVPRSPEAAPRPAGLLENLTTTTAAKSSDVINNVSDTRDRSKVSPNKLDRSDNDVHVTHQEFRTQAAPQITGEIVGREPNLNTTKVNNVSSHRQKAMGSSPRKKPKLTHPYLGHDLRRQAQPQTDLIHKSVQKPREQDHTKKVQIRSPAFNQRSDRILPLPLGASHEKIPGLSTVHTAPKGQQKVVTSPQKQVDAGRKAAPPPHKRQLQPAQPTRRSRRRSGQATFYELGWDCTQQPQKTKGPVYDAPCKPLKTKPRRLPPVPDE